MGTQALCNQCGKPLAAETPEGLCPQCLLKAALNTRNSSPPSAAPGTQPDPLPDPRLLMQWFPQLEILELIGQGGMGAVYKARQPALDRLVALKILPARAGADPGFTERFTREARALARLNHPNIVAVYDFGQTRGLHYFIMEYVDGPSLRRIEEAGKLSPREALQIIPQICAALQFAHDEGVVHRDIKPENVLLDKKGRIKIADFGLAKILGMEARDWRLTGARDVMGTPHYMAPEQVEHPQEVDHRADIYSLGVVFYEMLTGELPLGKFAPPSRKVQVDVRLDEVVLHALEKEPARRYQHASEVKSDVETIVNHPGARLAAASAAVETAVGATQGRARPEFWKVAVGALAGTLTLLLVAAVLAVALYVLTRSNKRQASAGVPSGIALSLAPEAPVPAVAPAGRLRVPPVVIKTVPESGAADIESGLNELQVTFSAPMADRCWAWTTMGEDTFPEMGGAPRFLADGRTCVLSVKLKPDHVYAVWLNSETHDSFRDRAGTPAVPYLLIFKTKP